jgi:hypothetical protein
MAQSSSQTATKSSTVGPTVGNVEVFGSFWRFTSFVQLHLHQRTFGDFNLTEFVLLSGMQGIDIPRWERTMGLTKDDGDANNSSDSR